MRAMVMIAARRPLELQELDPPAPGSDQVAIDVEACGICRTDLHILDGDLEEPKLPLVPGHQIVGRVAEVGAGVRGLSVGDRVGVPWLGWTCGECEHCSRGRENLCDRARFTGYHIDGGLAERCVADARFAFPLPDHLSAVQAAPLLCAGLIGYRSYRMVDAGARRIGLYGFGAAAHILIQVARHQKREVFAFTRPGDEDSQRFARTLGAAWAGGSDERPPELLDAAILFAPVGSLVPAALKAVRKGGQVICGGIHMSPIPEMPYSVLWGERSLRSVANLTRQDGEDFLALAPSIPVETTVHEYGLEDAGRALDDLRHGRFDGAAVIVP
jgi:propanol-preferring alcohol dehydrogenase